MQILPVDLVALVGTILGISIVLIPVIGVTARIALKPTAEALARFFDHQGLTDTVRVLERRLDFQEHQIDTLEGQLRRLTEGSEFDRRLLEARGEAPRPAPSHPTEQE
jgi:hypothetical protein